MVKPYTRRRFLNTFINPRDTFMKFSRTLPLLATAAMFISLSSHGYLSRHEAVTEATSIICRLFTWSSLDYNAQAKLNDFIQDFTKNTFSYGVNYMDFNEANVAEMAIESAAEWIAQQSISIAIREVMTDSTFNPHFNGQNYFNQEALKKAIHRAMLAQVKRVTKKPLERVNCGDFKAYIGESLRAKVRELISLMIARDCGAYCDERGPKMLLYCGHMLHRSCFAQLQKPARCPQCRDSLAYLEQKPTPVFQPTQTPRPVYQPAMPRPSAPVYQPQSSADNDNSWYKWFISIGLISK